MWGAHKGDYHPVFVLVEEMGSMCSHEERGFIYEPCCLGQVTELPVEWAYVGGLGECRARTPVRLEPNEWEEDLRRWSQRGSRVYQSEFDQRSRTARRWRWYSVWIHYRDLALHRSSIAARQWGELADQCQVYGLQDGFCFSSSLQVSQESPLKPTLSGTIWEREF